MKDGGPAFPNEGFNGWGKPFDGMTLRDYFAAKALQAFIGTENELEMRYDRVAEIAYSYADAMLKAREQ